MSEELQKLLSVGKKYHAEGNLEKALQTYGKMLSLDRRQPIALYLSGVVFLQAGQHDKAIQFLKGSIAVAPNNAEANNNLGVAYNAAGNLANAEASYRKAISLKPDYAAAYKNLGALLASNDRLAEGLEAYGKMVDLAPNSAEGHKAIGDILCAQQKYEEALQSYMHARALNPADAEVLTSAGITLQFLSRHQEALKLHSQAINLAPRDEERHWSAFSDCVSNMSFSSTNADLESSMLVLLEKSDISPATLMFPIISALRHCKDFSRMLDNSGNISSDRQSLTEHVRTLTQLPLFMRLMTRVPIADLRIERLLTSLRSSLLSQALKNQLDDSQILFLTALAQQCFINEYVYAVDATEQENLACLNQKIEDLSAQGQEIPVPLWLTAGCYQALKDVLWKNRISRPQDDADLLQVYVVQISAPATEASLSETIPRLTEIEDETSQNVRAQYEENPYPRWMHTVRLTPKPVEEVLCAPPMLFDIKDYRQPKNLETLVAGCGTGQHAIQAASRFSNTKLTAVDLSLSSLSYAKRKTREMEITNIDYIQGDILELDRIGKQFDIIECGGVLHHMANPIKGWEVLVRLLRKNGLMKIGLYSEKGRPDIITARDFIAQGDYGSSPDEIRRCRQDIIAAAENGNQGLIQLCMRSDFYSLSPCRDLIFHVQEHRFTIPKISKALKKLGLEFIGFETPTPQTLAQFRKENPSCPKGQELDLWHNFEERFPETFRGMYQFWCRKKTR